MDLTEKTRARLRWDRVRPDDAAWRERLGRSAEFPRSHCFRPDRAFVVSPGSKFTEASERKRDFVIRDVIIVSKFPLGILPVVRRRPRRFHTSSRLCWRLSTSFGFANVFR